MNKIVQLAFNTLRSIKSVSVATVSNGLPQNRIMDIMLVEKETLFFITARGKSVYRQLKKTPRIAICALDKHYNAIRVNGDIKFCKQRKIMDKIFEQNPILNDLYPGKKREILEVFQVYKGEGEIFELSKSPIVRTHFVFGGVIRVLQKYVINNTCISCGACFDVCPNKAVLRSMDNNYSINNLFCLECGGCFEVCPVNAIDLLKTIRKN